MSRKDWTLPNVSIDRLASDEANVNLAPYASYMRAYQEFLQYFKNVDVITPHHLIIAAHFAYGWMPTILELYEPYDGFGRCTALRNDAKHGKILGVGELELLRSAVNNSFVGASKLLHFINPEIHAIWDSRVCNYITSGNPSTHIYRVTSYLEYLRNCRELSMSEWFPPIHAAINDKVGYAVSAYRAIELIMYENGPRMPKPDTKSNEPIAN